MNDTHTHIHNCRRPCRGACIDAPALAFRAVGPHQYSVADSFFHVLYWADNNHEYAICSLIPRHTLWVRQLCEHNFSNNRCCFALKIMREYSEKIWNLWIIIQQCFVTHGGSVGYEFDVHTQSGVPDSSKSLEAVFNPANSGTDSESDVSPVASHVVSVFDWLKAL